jgi:hypothetical protein
MLMSLVLVAYIFAAGQTDASEPSPLVTNMDRYAAGQCLGSRVGFRNLRLNCVSGDDGKLQQCEVLSQDPRVLRYTPIFRCMAGTVTVTNPDGSLAVGRPVTFTLDRTIWAVTPRSDAPQD